MSDLAPCRRCGCPHIRFAKARRSKYYIVAQCQRCGATGLPAIHEDPAAASWNKIQGPEGFRQKRSV